ncbi:hypothetical protein Q5741_20100 [Paenibacillus sp. JX-17]|uniref:Lipoprotein n=1 Tax=Paenibacillus lacisoli TaxID=3064525 RepID=A0ABT9CJH7_9BACL|nr:DUF6612 family protein [Paenibacillus sp. JX-17]MDO7908693.1 hypothetical protein [Paenibacillus sp. JX-17]
MSKKYTAAMLALLLTVMVALAGCGAKQQEPKEAVKSAAANATKMTSYAMKSKFTLDNLSIVMKNESENAAIGNAMSYLKNAELTVDGVYQADPMQTEMTMNLALKGDMAMTFTVPMVMTKEKLFVKIPNIPMLPMPEKIVGKFLEMDLKELAEESGTEFSPDSLDQAKMQQLSTDVINAILAEYDQTKYFKNIKPSDAGLPEGVDAKQVVQFSVDNSNVKEAVTIFVNKSMPKVLDVLSKPEYRDMLQIKQEDLDEAKKELQSTDQSELNKTLNEMKDHLKVNKFNINMAMNKDNYPVYQNIKTDVEVQDEEMNVKVAFTGSSQYSKINEKQDFKIGIPTGDQVITMEQLQQETGSTY